MLELKNVSFEVKEEGRYSQILKDISLMIPEGTFFVITGPNGSGKSTLAKIIMGILKPTSGKIFFNGEEITSTSIMQRAKLGISFSFQQPVKIKGISVYELIEIAAENNLSPEEVKKCIENVGLNPDDYLSREIDNSLSGGELKRIEIASVLARKSKLTIFDEPEAGIDLWSFDDLIKIFKKMQRDNRTTVVISHQERILNVADQIIVLENGTIKDIGAKDKVLPRVLKGAIDGIK